jgi:DNA-binding transcriptional LysR family regulator
MNRLEELRVFVQVGQSVTFSAAARALNLTQSSVSRKIASLEKHLGLQLVTRTSRAVALSESGKEFYRTASRLIDEFDTLIAGAREEHAMASGVVRVTIPETLAARFVVPQLPTLLGAYPNLKVELLPAEEPSALIQNGADLAVHSGDLFDSGLVVNKIAATRVVTVATPEYLDQKGNVRRVEDLTNRDTIVFLQYGKPKPWIFHGDEKRIYRSDGQFRTANASQMHAAVMQHVGIANAPLWLFQAEIQAGAVQRLLPDTEWQKPIFAVRPEGRPSPKRVAVFVEFLRSVMKTSPQQHRVMEI